MESIVAKLWRTVVEASTSTRPRSVLHPTDTSGVLSVRDNDDTPTVYAGFWRRLGALLLDGIILLPITGTVTWASAQSRLAALLLLLPSTAIFWGYHVYFHARWGQTLGKMATRVRVLSVDGARIGLRQALLRSAVDILLSGCFVAAQTSALLQVPAAEYASLGWLEQSRRLSDLLGQWQWLYWLQNAWMISEVVTMLFNRRRRALHDLIAGTIVVRVQSEGPVREPVAA